MRLRAGLIASLVLHGGLALLVVLAAAHRNRPPEPLPPPSYAMVFRSGAPERPAEAAPEPAAPESAPSAAADPLPAVAEPSPAPSPGIEDPPAAPAQQEAETRTPDPPATTAEPPSTSEEAAVPPSPPVLAEAPPAPPTPEDAAQPLPVPVPPEPVLPDPAPSRPEQHAALPVPPRPVPPPPPARPAPPQQLPGLWLPGGMSLAPPRPPSSRDGLDLSLGAIVGRMTPEPEMRVRGAQVGPDWRSAFSAWWRDHRRYPAEAVLLGHQGVNRLELLVAPDGRVRSARLVRPSGSVWLDSGMMNLFRGAALPPFPPGADPDGVTIDLTIRHILIRN